MSLDKICKRIFNILYECNEWAVTNLPLSVQAVKRVYNFITHTVMHPSPHSLNIRLLTLGKHCIVLHMDTQRIFFHVQIFTIKPSVSLF